MSEIKFRGIKSDDNGWVYGSLIGKNIIVKEIIEINDQHIHIGEWYRVKEETVGQFTGYKDKNGNDIYIGDILNIDMYPYMHGEGKYNYSAQVCSDIESNEFFLYCFKKKNSKVAGIAEGNTHEIVDLKDNSCEVIGNIYEGDFVND